MGGQALWRRPEFFFGLRFLVNPIGNISKCISRFFCLQIGFPRLSYYGFRIQIFEIAAVQALRIGSFFIKLAFVESRILIFAVYIGGIGIFQTVNSTISIVNQGFTVAIGYPNIVIV